MHFFKDLFSLNLEGKKLNFLPHSLSFSSLPFPFHPILTWEQRHANYYFDNMLCAV